VPWNLEYAGNADLMDAFMRNPQFKNMEMDTITLANGATIDNAVNNVLEFNEGGEDLLLTFSSNTVTLTSTLGVVLWDFALVVPKSDQFLFDPVTAPVGTVEGTVYYDSDDDNLYVRTTAGLVDLTASASGVANLDQAYDGGGSGAGKAVTVDQGAVALTATDAANNVILALVQQDTATAKVLTITNAGTGNTIDIEGQAGGKDIEGTGDAWNVSGAGAGTFATITTTAGGTIGTTLGVGTTLTVTGGTVANGDVDLGNAVTDTVTITGYIDADLSLDDGSGSPPQLIFRDGSDETAALLKTLTGSLTLTTQSDDGLNIAIGNLRVGNGTPGTAAMDGEDAYFEGEVEFDSQVTHDAVTVMNDWLDLNEELDIDMDASDETVTITTSATDYAADSAVVTINASGAGATNNTYLLRLRQATANDAQDHYLVMENNNGDDLLAVNSGGITTWSMEATGYVQIDADTAANTTTAGVLDLNVKSATAANVGIHLDYEMDDGGSATQYGLYIDLDDDAAGADETFDALYIVNSAGTNATMNGVVFANTVDTDIVAVLPVAGKFATVDAATADNTVTTGVVDIEYDSVATNGEAVNIKATQLTGGAGVALAAVELELDSDSGNASDILYGLIVNATDTTATGKVKGLYVKGAGIDAALQADTGYVRIGTGSSFTTTLGDDDLGVEGDLEVDGAVILDGGTLTLGNGVILSTAKNNRYFELTENSDTFGIIAGSDILELASCSTGLTTFDFNDIDRLVDVETLTFESGAVFTDVVGGGLTLDATTTVGITAGTNWTLTATAGTITLTQGAAGGVLVSTNAKTKRYRYFPIGSVSATAVTVGGGGSGNLCVGLTAGVEDIGTAEGYVDVDDAADFLRFSIPMPDTWIDTGTQADLVLAFDILEIAAEEVNIDIRIFEKGNVSPILVDTLVVANGAGRAYVPLVTNATGIGNDTDIDGDDTLLIELTSTADADDFRIYGVRLTYRVGLQATQ